jgi:type III restriction enzyme
VARADLLNLVVEIKGYRRIDAQNKRQAMETHWVPAVNNHGGFGH